MEDMNIIEGQTLYDVIVIGAGPAGLTAAIYTSRACLRTLIIENPSIVSQATYADMVENYPGFPEGINGSLLLEKFKNHAGELGAEIIRGEVENIAARKKEDRDIWGARTEGRVYDSLSVIIASGARAKRLGLVGEEKFLGRGVSYCAVCDGAFFKDKIIAVVGGGDTAVEEALFLSRFGKKVFLIHRRDRLRAAKILQERVFANKRIEIVWNSVVDEIIGRKRVEALTIKDIAAGAKKNLSCEGVFISVGLLPSTDFVKETVDLDEKGCVLVDNRMKTSKAGIFACGDCRNNSLRQIVTACGDGALAAFSAQEYVEEIKGTSYK